MLSDGVTRCKTASRFFSAKSTALIRGGDCPSLASGSGQDRQKNRTKIEVKTVVSCLSI